MRRSLPLLGMLAALAIATAARTALEATMLRHMLVQLPLLFAAGALGASMWSGGPRSTRGGWNAHGVAGLLLASGIVAAWMVPRALDAAVESTPIDVLKFASIPVAGALSAVSWRQAGTEVRAFMLGNAAWMTATVGMLFLDAPIRLCANYAATDQRATGYTLLIATAGIAAMLGARILRRPDARARSGTDARSGSAAVATRTS